MEKVPLRRIYERIEPPVRRDRLDDEHLRLLTALCLPKDADRIDAGRTAGCSRAKWFVPEGYVRPGGRCSPAATQAVGRE
jgi:hypothetical protein